MLFAKLLKLPKVSDFNLLYNIILLLPQHSSDSLNGTLNVSVSLSFSSDAMPNLIVNLVILICIALNFIVNKVKQ